MKWLIGFLIVLLSLPSLADPRADYEDMKVQIQEQRRQLQALHARREYTMAIPVQKKTAELSSKALELALKSREIGDSGAWKYHADVLLDCGQFDKALESIDSYMKTPLLDRGEQLRGRRKRVSVYQRWNQWEKALQASQSAFSLADKPREKFSLLREQAAMHLKMDKPGDALALIPQIRELRDQVDARDKLSANRDIQDLLTQIYREMGKKTEARAAKKSTMEWRLKLMQRELDEFDQKYPES